MIILGADPLSRFLNAAAQKPFAWGEHDCLLWLADWIGERTGHDPAADLRGAYSSMLQAAKIVRGAGGMVRLVETRLKAFDAPRLKSGARGGVAIVKVAGDGGENFGDQAGAILLEGSAAILSQGGLAIAPLPVVAAWSV